MVTVRTVSKTVTFAGNVLADVISARGSVSADGGWPTCSVFVRNKPATGNEEDDLDVVAGAGNNVTRFTGKMRHFRASAFPRGIEMVSMGTLAYAAEWSPDEDIELDVLLGTDTGTDQDIIKAILDMVPGVSYTSGNIAGRGVTLGVEAPEQFTWRAGTSAWQQIQTVDRATLYRTYQDRNGTIRRVHMIGHPNSTADFTLTLDNILEGATGERETESTRNAVRVKGWDDGNGAVLGLASGAFGSLDGTGPDQWKLSEYDSGMIEDGNDDLGTPVGNAGIDAQDIADEMLGDVLKEFVKADVPSWVDSTHGPGLTCLLDSTNADGKLVLLIAEKMWVWRYDWEVSDNGWSVRYGLSGGGTDQTYTPPTV